MGLEKIFCNSTVQRFTGLFTLLQSNIRKDSALLPWTGLSTTSHPSSWSIPTTFILSGRLFLTDLGWINRWGCFVFDLIGTPFSERYYLSLRDDSSFMCVLGLTVSALAELVPTFTPHFWPHKRRIRFSPAENSLGLTLLSNSCPLVSSCWLDCVDDHEHLFYFT